MLILDEPANGLDPAGIRWMRDLLRGFADDGGTVLLSSHLLHEIEVVADDLVVIGNGRIVAQGTKAELLDAAGTVVRARDEAALLAALAGAGQPATAHPDGSVHTEASAETVGEIALAAGVPLHRAADRRRRTGWRRCSSGSPRRRSATTGDPEHDRSRSMSTVTTREPPPRAPAPPRGPGRARGRRHPGEPHRDPVRAAALGRADQDVRHPLGLLAAGGHRRLGGRRHRPA